MFVPSSGKRMKAIHCIKKKHFLLTKTFWLTAWETNSSLDSQEIPHILWNMKVYYCIYKILGLSDAVELLWSPGEPAYHIQNSFTNTPLPSSLT